MYNVIGVILGQLISIGNHYFSKNLKIKLLSMCAPTHLKCSMGHVNVL